MTVPVVKFTLYSNCQVDKTNI